MPDFNELQRNFWAIVEASERQDQGSPDAAGTFRHEGFGEASEVFSYSDSKSTIEAAETACLSFEVTSAEELQAKTEFILRLMRRLTDETEEFDVYAERLKADLKSVTTKSD